MLFNPMPAAPKALLSEDLYQEALGQARVDIDALPGTVYQALKAHLHDHLSSEWEAEFDRRYFVILDRGELQVPRRGIHILARCADSGVREGPLKGLFPLWETAHKCSLALEATHLLEHQVKHDLQAHPLSKEQVVDRTARIVCKTLFGIARPLTTPEPDLSLPLDVTQQISCFLLGESSSWGDLQDTLRACEAFIGTGMEIVWMGQAMHFVLTRLRTLEQSPELSPAYASIVARTTQALQRQNTSHQNIIHAIQDCLRRFDVALHRLTQSSQALLSGDGNLIASACELGYRLRISNPSWNTTQLFHLPAQTVLRILRSEREELPFRVWAEGFTSLVRRACQPGEPEISNALLMDLLMARSSWKKSSTCRLPLCVSQLHNSCLARSLIEYSAPLALLKPVLQEWVKLHPPCSKVSSFSWETHANPGGSPLMWAAGLARLDLVNVLLDLGVSPYETCFTCASIEGQRNQHIGGKTPFSVATRGGFTFSYADRIQTYYRRERRAQHKKILDRLCRVPDLPIAHLTGTLPLALGDLLVCFSRDRTAPAHAIFGLAAKSRGLEDLECRLQLLEEGLLAEDVEALMRREVHPDLTTQVIQALLHEAASLIRSGRGTSPSQQNLLSRSGF